MKKVVFRGRRVHSIFRPFSIILNRINHHRSKKHIGCFPQLAIFAFDHIGLMINSEGRYERDSLELIEKFVLRDDQFDADGNILDIGANIGNHSIFFSEYCNCIYAFEPNPRTYKLLEFNSFSKNIVPFNYGLSDRNCTVNFFVNSLNIGGSRILDDNIDADSREITKIEVKRLDDLSEVTKSKISLIKIDVEGHELSVLNGARNIIERDAPVILFEQGIEEIFEGSSKVIDLLRSLGYRFYTIENRFFFGEALHLKIASLALRAIFGYQKNIVEKECFERRFFEMIIAVK